jgi:hypothetical protein
MSFVAIVEIINFCLATTAALISFGIYKRVAGDLAESWKYSSIAFSVLAFAMLFTVMNEFGVKALVGINVSLLRNMSHFFFVVLAFLGLSRQYHILRDLTERSE